MIVIPQRRRRLTVGIRRRKRVELWTTFTMSCKPCLRIAIVIRQCTGAVQMSDIANCWKCRLRTMNRWINWQKMARRQLTNPFDLRWLSSTNINRRAGPRTVIPPDRCGRQVAMHLLTDFAHFNFDHIVASSRGTNYLRDRQRIDIAGKFDAATHLRRRGHNHTALAKSRNSTLERESSCCIKAVMKKTTSIQHCLVSCQSE